jgi:hypothetical protein
LRAAAAQLEMLQLVLVVGEAVVSGVEILLLLVLQKLEGEVAADEMLAVVLAVVVL